MYDNDDKFYLFFERTLFGLLAIHFMIRVYTIYFVVQVP